VKVLLDKVGGKVRKLIISHNQLIQKNELLIIEKEDSIKKINSLKSEINNLNHRLNEIRISNSFQHNDNDSGLAKKKINMFLREIDKCIALLNN
jgi:predicted nuclease with TOPRIM domain